MRFSNLLLGFFGLVLILNGQAVIQRTNCPKTIQSGTVVVAQSASIQGNSSPVIILSCYQLNPSQISIQDNHDGTTPIISIVSGLSATPGGSAGQVQTNVGGTTLGGVTISGDGTLNTTTGLFTLKTVNQNPGTCGDQNHTPVITTDAQGRITSFSCSSIQGSGSGAGATNFSSQEPLGGTYNGSNVNFTVTNYPIIGSLAIYRNGLRLGVNVDYSVTNFDSVHFQKQITFLPLSIPKVGDTLFADYQY
jgi:hypothetical protein